MRPTGGHKENREDKAESLADGDVDPVRSIWNKKVTSGEEKYA